MRIFSQKTVKRILMVTLLVMAVVIQGGAAGQLLPDVTVQDSQKKPAKIPYFGKKVITIFYNDVDTADIGDPLADAIKAKKYDKSQYEGIGIANCKDAPFKPNWAIRLVVRDKVKKFNSTILLDVDHSMKKAWNLGKTNDTCVFIIIGKDKRVLYKKSFTSAAAGKAVIPTALKVLDSVIK